jgi:hypothetical protein
MEALDQSDRVLRLVVDILCRPTSLAFLCALIITIIFFSAILSFIRSLWIRMYWIYSIKVGHVLLLAVAVLIAYTGIENSKTFLSSIIEEWGWEVKERVAEWVVRFL